MNDQQPQEQCFICKLDNATIRNESGGFDVYHVMCDRCGSYRVTDDFIRYFDAIKLKEIGYILSAVARERYETGAPQALFRSDEAELYTSDYNVPDLKNIKEKSYKFIERLNEQSEHFGFYIDINYVNDFPLAYAKNKDEFIAQIDLLEQSGLIEKRRDTTFRCQVRLTAEGIDISNTLRKTKNESDQGFVAIWFNKSMDATIQAIELAITESGYKPICIRDEHFSEKIMDKALGEIRKSKFLVVDLTGNRSSVFFEAGFAFGLDIDIIYVYKKGSEKSTPLDFYVRHYKCYEYEKADDLKNILSDAISARIK